MFSYGEVDRVRNSLVNELALYRPEWQLAAMFVAPKRYRNQSMKGQRGGRNIIKNRAGRSLQTFVSGMSNGATPRSRPWFKREVGNSTKMQLSAVKRYLSVSDDIINQHFQMSNLYGVLPLSYKDVGVFSNSAFAMLPHPKYGFYFYPYAIGTYGFACSLEGDTNMFTRDFTLSVKQVVDSYGTLKRNSTHIDWTKFPSWVKTCYENADYQQELVLNETYLPNKNYEPSRVNKLDGNTKKFHRYSSIRSMGSNLPLQSSSGFRNEKSIDPSNQFIRVDGYSYFPVITPRWEVQAEENYGVDGPTQMALSDIMTLQEMQKGRLEGVNKLLRPPMVGHASLRRHQASILAGGITYVDDQGAAHGFKPAFAMDPRISELVNSMQEYEDEIRYAYFEHLFLQFSGEETKSHVTAAEINERSAEKMAALAPVMGQLDRDQNGPIIRNAQLILEDLGRLPPRPKEIEGEELRPEYISILAQASKVSMLNSMERGMNFLVTASDALQDPSLRKLINGEAYAREYLEYVAIKPTLILDETEFNDAREVIAQQNQQNMALQQQQVASETAKNFSQAEIGRGSMLDSMMDAANA